MHYFIVTGTSRGIGEATAKRLMSNDHYVFCLSRSGNQSLMKYAKDHQFQAVDIICDLNDSKSLEAIIGEIFRKMTTDEAESISLLNNAGVVQPIKPIEKCSSDEIIKNINVNLTAPMILTSAFIRLSESLNIEKRIINISSGAGNNPYFGWSNYCSAKAGLNLFTQCVALEQESKIHPVKVLAIAPGVVDTEMQEEIRSTDEKDFVHIERFKKLKKEGKLLSPDHVAEGLVDKLLGKDFEQGGILRIQDLLK